MNLMDTKLIIFFQFYVFCLCILLKGNCILPFIHHTKNPIAIHGENGISSRMAICKIKLKISREFYYNVWCFTEAFSKKLYEFDQYRFCTNNNSTQFQKFKNIFNFKSVKIIKVWSNQIRKFNEWIYFHDIDWIFFFLCIVVFYDNHVEFYFKSQS